MATIYADKDIDPTIIQGLKVAVLGYGNQGHAHALNLRDSGVEVRIGLHTGSKSAAKALENGFPVLAVAEASQWADVLMFCTPDVPMKDIYAHEVKPNLRIGQTLLFAHGFNIHFGYIQPPEDVTVALVSPKGAGHWLRHNYLEGSGLAALVAVHQDPTGDALAIALSYAAAIGSARVGIMQTTFREETETDLFGEQAVLCGGVPELIKAGFQTLIDAGYQPEAAFFETVHEVKLVVDLMFSEGIEGMRRRISDTAEWGGYLAGPRVINAASRNAMRQLLAEIQNGTFAKGLLAEAEAGMPIMNRFRAETTIEPVELTRQALKEQMPKLYR